VGKVLLVLSEPAVWQLKTSRACWVGYARSHRCR